jgi:proline iminopeptidase
LFKDVYPEGMEREDAVSFASRMGDKSAATQILREYFSMLFYSPENRETAFAKLRAIRERLGPREDHPEVQAAILKDLEGFDLSPELAKYSFPTIVMTGRFDMNVAPAVAYKIHKTIPGSQFVVFEHSGHMPFYDEPAEFLQTVESFLK